MSDEEFVHPGRAPRQLSDVVNKVLQRMKVSDSGSSMSLFSQWRDIVGDAIADHVTPKRLEKRVLTVEVDDPAWATQLKFLEKQLLSTLRTKAGDEVDSLDVKVRRSR
jgi:predicted nucleic acid-binding Zn ribbon protein